MVKEKYLPLSKTVLKKRACIFVTLEFEKVLHELAQYILSLHVSIVCSILFLRLILFTLVNFYQN